VTAERKLLLDASALLAMIRNEPGADQVLRVLDDCRIHAVNLAEVIRKMVAKGMTVPEATGYLRELQLDVIEEFTQVQAFAVANWTGSSLRLGLSLGDAVCLMAAHWYDLTILTAERRWSELEGVQQEIIQIRPR
jgi:PIN domain nuclease of toxin-antitoxin system